jgi:hydrocephalus-inducing protein
LLQISFEFTSQELTLVESFWRFHIPEQNISVPFLLVGQAREPDISMDRSHMNFKALLIGRLLLIDVKKYMYILNSRNTKGTCFAWGLNYYVPEYRN